MGECTVDQYNLGEMEIIFPEADERRESKRKEENDSKQKWPKADPWWRPTSTAMSGRDHM